MMVLDASAILAYLQGEAGAPAVLAALEAGAACSTANWSEVAQKLRQRGADWPTARAVLESYGIDRQPVTVDDAELAATIWEAHPALSLADRLCLALGARLSTEVLTTDRAWESVAQSVTVIR